MPDRGTGLTAREAETLAARLRAALDAKDVDAAVRRWSRDVPGPADVLALVDEVRDDLDDQRRAGLRHVERLAVSAVAQRQLQAALTDPLTGLSTRARLEDEVRHLIGVSLRERSPLTAVMIDLDGLKRINDHGGHAAGDAAIADVGAAIRAHLRLADRAYRFGGDEFALFLPGTTAEGARVLVERIRHAARTPVSVGLAVHSGKADDLDVAAWLDRADTAMYGARSDRRDDQAVPRRRRRTRGAGALVIAGALVSGTGAVLVPAAVHALHEDTPVGTVAAPRVELPTDAVPQPRRTTPARPAPQRHATPAPVAHAVVVPPARPVQAPAPRGPRPPVVPAVVPTKVPVLPDLPVLPTVEPSPGSGLVTSVVDTVGKLVGRLL